METINTNEGYNTLIEANRNNGWINPEFEPLNEKYLEDYFMIKLDDFTEIQETAYISGSLILRVTIVRISKLKYGQVVLFCRIRGN